MLDLKVRLIAASRSFLERLRTQMSTMFIHGQSRYHHAAISYLDFASDTNAVLEPSICSHASQLLQQSLVEGFRRPQDLRGSQQSNCSQFQVSPYLLLISDTDCWKERHDKCLI